MGSWTIIAFVAGSISIIKILWGNNSANSKKPRPSSKPKNELSDTITELASGNIQTAEVLTRLLNIRSNTPALLRNIQASNIRGYQIALCARAVKNDMMQLTSHFESKPKLRALVNNIEQRKALTLPTKDEQSIKAILAQHELDNIDDAFAEGNLQVIRSAMGWRQFYKDFQPDSDLTYAVFDFLVPDAVDCGQWLINWRCLKDQFFLYQNREELSPSAQQIADGVYIGYPLWFLAAYPQVVLWAAKAIDNGNLNKSTLKRFEAEEQSLNSGDKLSRVLLRMLIDDYQKQKVKGSTI